MGLISYLADDAWKLLDVFGELLTHKPRAKAVDAEPVNGAFEEEESQADTSAGRENVRRGWIEIPSETPNVSKDSVWVIRGQEWQTDRIGTPDFGLLKVHVVRRDSGIRDGKARPAL